MNRNSALKVIINLLLITTCILLLAGCATKVKMRMLQPAPYHEASKTRSVAVMPFSGAGGYEYASELESVLFGIEIDGERYFTVVDRREIERVIDELKLSQSGLTDEESAAEVGKLVGAQGIYTGAITHSACKDNYYTEKRRECAEREIKYTKKGKPYEGKCIRWETNVVSCTKRRADFVCTPKLIDVNTGRIIYSRTLSGTAESSGCEDQAPIKGRDLLMRESRDSVKAEFRKDIAPYYITSEVKLMDSAKGIESAEARANLKKGLKFAAKQRMDRACELWQEARRQAPASPVIIYNLGVCAESRGDFALAHELFLKADSLTDKPVDEITRAIDQVGKALRNQEVLREQMDRG